MCDINVPMQCSDKIDINFLMFLYEGTYWSNINKLKYRIFSSKKDPTKNKILPRTILSAVQHVKRVYLQTLIWCAAAGRGTQYM